MTNFVMLTFLIPLFTAIVSILMRKTRFRTSVSILGSLSYLVSVLYLTFLVLSNGAIAYQAGGWAAPFGITFVADALSILMLLMTALVSLAGNLYSTGYIPDKGKESGFFAFFHFMLAGMTGAFLTGDLFNLFVMFEIVLMSSYAMVSYSGCKSSLFASLKYVVLNLIGSSLMLIAIGGLYSVTGTLNIADMAVILSEGAVNMSAVLGLSLILFSVFAIKSGLVPFHFWAPPVYAESPPQASAMMAGISKKVGIYAIIRLYMTIFAGAQIPVNASLVGGMNVTSVVGPLLLIMSFATILVGGISAVNRKKLDRLLSYSSIGQVGFIMIPVALAMITGSKLAVIAALIYLLNHGVAKSSLFMISGIIEKISGTTNLEELGGLSEKSMSISAAFFVAAFSLVGIPPLLGFFGKMLVAKTAIVTGSGISLLTILFGAVMTLVYFGKSWLKIFFGEAVDFDLENVSRREIWSVLFLGVLIVSLGVGLEPVYQLADMAAQNVLEPTNYIETVLGDTR